MSKSAGTMSHVLTRQRHPTAQAGHSRAWCKKSSQVLGLARRQLVQDWKIKYAVKPVLEAVGLPTTLADLGLADPDRARLIPVAEKACAPGECIHNEVGVITPEKVLHALIAADALGRARKKFYPLRAEKFARDEKAFSFSVFTDVSSCSLCFRIGRNSEGLFVELKDPLVTV